DVLHAMRVRASLGVTISGALGTVDSIVNAPSGQRLIRVLGAAAFGLIGGLFAGMLVELLTKITPWLRFMGWIIVGVGTGASINIYELIQSLLSGKPFALAKQ